MEYRTASPCAGVLEKVLVATEELVDQATLMVKLSEASDD